MPYAVTHILIPLILADIYRDHVAKKKFNLHYVAIVGLSGILPDIDILFFFVINIFKNVPLGDVHRTFTHSLWFPLLFFMLYFIFKNKEIIIWKKHRLDLKYVLIAIGFGTITHSILDGFLVGTIMPLFPLSEFKFGLNIIPTEKFHGTFFSGLDAALLVIWLVHEELNHKISDYI
jgi:membrane-bound metal-dependent hydrolase YbcI (DUF457 family)